MSSNDLQNEFLRRASEIALSSTCKRYKLGTIIVNRKRRSYPLDTTTTQSRLKRGHLSFRDRRHPANLKIPETKAERTGSIRRPRKQQRRYEIRKTVQTTTVQSFGIKRVYYSYSECGEKFNDADEPKETYTVHSINSNLTKKK
jgi:hypothetical protein